MIKEALLGLLAGKPMHGYDLKVGLDKLFGRASPVNVGQVYTAIAKMEKAGLIEGALVVRDQQRPETKVYHLTPAGLDSLRQWFAEPVERVDLRDEFFVKLSLAQRTGRGDVAAIVRAQRAAALRDMQELTALRERFQGEQEVDLRLLVEGAVLHLEADLAWLELWEKRFARRGDKKGGTSDAKRDGLHHSSHGSDPGLSWGG